MRQCNKTDGRCAVCSWFYCSFTLALTQPIPLIEKTNSHRRLRI
jgi:hypothetical protein